MVQKCKEGLVKKKGKCVKKRGVVTQVKEKTSFSSFQLGGLILLGLGFLVFKFMPQEDCFFLNIFCHLRNQAVSSGFLVVAGILMLVGVFFLLNKPFLNKIKGGVS